MDVRALLGIERSDRSRWQLAVTRQIATPGEFLFGGCGLAGGVLALEEASGRPTVWATAQFLSYAPVGDVVEYEVVLPAVGRQLTHGRAVARSGGREVLTVNAALGQPQLDLDRLWVSPPTVPPPATCPPRLLPGRPAGSILDRVETRIASGTAPAELTEPGPPDSALWARLPGQGAPSPATLAIFGDYVSGSTSQPLGRFTLGRSLDNTLRVGTLVETEWVLLDIRIHAVAGGYSQGLAFLWSEDGVLLGTASQSASLRYAPDDFFTVPATRAHAPDADR